MAEQVKPIPPARGTPMSPLEAMTFAIAEGQRGFAHVSPNPLVGCVILDEQGGFLSSGFHARWGEAHAEVNAAAGLREEDWQNAQVFVTLEPCAHQGRTPSCARMLAKRPVGKVVYGLVDPDPRVRGQGAAILREAGIPCQLFEDIAGPRLQRDLEELCEKFLWNVRHQSPFVTLKIAASLDGRVALEDGTSQWITGSDSRQQGHRLRAAHDAVLVGTGTLVKDDPALNVRLDDVHKSTAVVILGTEEPLPERPWKILATHSGDQIHWFCPEGSVAKPPHGVRVHFIPAAEGYLDLRQVLHCLWNAGLRSILVEGGARVAGSFLKQGLVNRLELFLAPVLLGDRGLPWTAGYSVSNMAERPVLSATREQVLGRDRWISGLLRDPQTGLIFRDM